MRETERLRETEREREEEKGRERKKEGETYIYISGANKHILRRPKVNYFIN